MTEKTEKELKRIPWIWYLVIFKDWTEALLDSKSKVNAMRQAFASQLGFRIQKTNIGVKKIDDTTLETYRIVVSTFSISNKYGKERFFKESFLLTDINPDVVFGIFFLTISNVNIDFQA